MNTPKERLEKARFEFGKRLESIRKQRGMRQVDLADAMGVSKDSVTRWENGLREPRLSDIEKLSSILSTSIAYLLGRPEIINLVSDPASNVHIPGADYDLVKLPVLSIENVVCAGDGYSLEYVESEIDGYEYISRADLGPIDEHNKPFIVRVEGDSMAEAGIPDGSRVAINPAATINDGESALVCYGLNKERAIKWVYWQTDGSVKIRSSNPRYEPRVFTKEDRELGFFCTVGRVMQVITKPLKG